jgi:hypothetical protein
LFTLLIAFALIFLSQVEDDEIEVLSSSSQDNNVDDDSDEDWAEWCAAEVERNVALGDEEWRMQDCGQLFSFGAISQLMCLRSLGSDLTIDEIYHHSLFIVLVKLKTEKCDLLALDLLFIWLVVM